jgi:hypothetical protein
VAIFGKLSDFPLREVLAVIGKRTGELLIEDAQGRRLRLSIAGERLTGLRLERSIHGPEAIQKVLQAIDEGTFHFENSVAETGPADCDLNLAELLTPRANPRTTPDIPHPDTIFMLIRGRTVTLEAEVQAFLDQATPLLESGSSATQMARELRLDLQRVREHLQQLREVKKIWPVRAHEQLEHRPELPTRRSLASRLMEIFR